MAYLKKTNPTSPFFKDPPQKNKTKQKALKMDENDWLKQWTKGLYNSRPLPAPTMTRT